MGLKLIIAAVMVSTVLGDFMQQGGTLVGTDTVGGAFQSYIVALSSDGNTLASGSPGDDSWTGAVWVFTRSGTTWSEQGSKLVGTGAVGSTISGAAQGYSVALSADGNTLASGGHADDSWAGAVWVFTRSKSTWSQQGPKLVGTDAVGDSEQGSSVSLSSDGKTLASGGLLDDSGAGAVWIFTRKGTTWSQQGSKLVGTGAVHIAGQGSSVGLSANGNILASGGLYDNSLTGAVWIFTRSGTTWSQQGSKLVGTGAVGIAVQGSSLALSSDGITLASGGRSDDSGAGAIWIFTRSGTTWSQQGSKLVGTGAVNGTVTGAVQGYSVALSSDGNTLASGGYADDSWAGAVWIFTRSGSTWSQQGPKLVGTGAVGVAMQGSSVALSSDGNTLASGGQCDNCTVGSGWIWVFAQPTFVPTPPPSKKGASPKPVRAFSAFFAEKWSNQDCTGIKTSSILYPMLDGVCSQDALAGSILLDCAADSITSYASSASCGGSGVTQTLNLGICDGAGNRMTPCQTFAASQIYANQKFGNDDVARCSAPRQSVGFGVLDTCQVEAPGSFLAHYDNNEVTVTVFPNSANCTGQANIASTVTPDICDNPLGDQNAIVGLCEMKAEKKKKKGKGVKVAYCQGLGFL